MEKRPFKNSAAQGAFRHNGTAGPMLSRFGFQSLPAQNAATAAKLPNIRSIDDSVVKDEEGGTNTVTPPEPPPESKSTPIHQPNQKQTYAEMMAAMRAANSRSS